MSIATDKLAEYLAAETQVLKGQRVRIDNGGVSRDVTMADLAEIRKGIAFWQNEVAKEQAKSSGDRSGSMRYRVPNFVNWRD
jgi:hypothetical protein